MAWLLQNLKEFLKQNYKRFSIVHCTITKWLWYGRSWYFSTNLL